MKDRVVLCPQCGTRMGYDYEGAVEWYKCFNGCGYKLYITPKNKLTPKQTSIELFNIVSNGIYNMNGLAPMFNEIDDALIRLEKIEKVIRELESKGMMESIFIPNAIADIKKIIKGEK